MKYFLDLTEDNFTLYTTDKEEKICSGKLSDIGIKQNDPDYSNKLDDYFEKEYNIKPNEWEIG